MIFIYYQLYSSLPYQPMNENRSKIKNKNTHPSITRVKKNWYLAQDLNSELKKKILIIGDYEMYLNECL